MIEQVEAPLHQIYVLSSLLSLTVEDEQRLLAAKTQREAFDLMHDFLAHELQVLEVRKQISDQAQSEMSPRAARVSPAETDARDPGRTR